MMMIIYFNINQMSSFYSLLRLDSFNNLFYLSYINFNSLFIYLYIKFYSMFF